MDNLELFEKWCEIQIGINEEVIKRMILDNEPKWEIQKSQAKNNIFECMATMKSLKRFKDEISR